MQYKGEEWQYLWPISILKLKTLSLKKKSYTLFGFFVDWKNLIQWVYSIEILKDVYEVIDLTS